MQGGQTVELSEALTMLEELKLMIENMDQKRSQLSPAAGRGMQGKYIVLNSIILLHYSPF